MAGRGRGPGRVVSRLERCRYSCFRVMGATTVFTNLVEFCM